ncbi:MAG: cation-translocating P-type ATPase, partial [Candidatus Bathyarchaeota archaeon]|nr:cation-translocating P-type ATPase [Candidatus Bathyarchaeota archaeon]
MRHEDAHFDGGLVGLVVSGASLAAGLLLRSLGVATFPASPLFLAAMVVSGAGIVEAGFRALVHGRISIDLLITIAAVGAFAIGHMEEGAAVLLLFNLAERLEDYAADRARRSIEALMELKPEVATVRRGGGEATVAIGDVWPGEVAVIRPGDRVPLDGAVIEGASSIDQAAITGESTPVSKLVGDDVFAGTINLDGFLAVRVTRLADETMLARILKMIEEAEERRSPTEALVDRFASFYTPAVILLALAVALVPTLLLGKPLHHWIYKALVMLVVACPCALAISTPVAMVSAISSAGRNGVLVKGGAYLEQVSRAGAFAFDKTGTLTRGELGVTDIVSFGIPEREVLRRAVALEAMAEHPIAKAILERARADGVEAPEATDFKAHVGRGVEARIEDRTCCIGNLRLFKELGLEPMDGVVERLEAEGKTVVLVSEDDCVVGAIALMDQIREGADDAMAQIRRRGIRVEMLTGDNEATA